MASVLGFLTMRRVGSQCPTGGLNPHSLHWKPKSQPLDSQGSLQTCLKRLSACWPQASSYSLSQTSSDLTPHRTSVRAVGPGASFRTGSLGSGSALEWDALRLGGGLGSAIPPTLLRTSPLPLTPSERTAGTCWVPAVLSAWLSSHSVSLPATLWTAARQASLSWPPPRVCSNSCLLSQWCHPAERVLLNHERWGFLASRREEFNPGQRGGLIAQSFCLIVLLNYKGDRESFWHRQRGQKERPLTSVSNGVIYS